MTVRRAGTSELREERGPTPRRGPALLRAGAQNMELPRPSRAEEQAGTGAPTRHGEPPAEEEARIEAMSQVSPEGRPPHHREAARSTLALVAAGVVLIGGAVLLWAVGGPTAIGMGFVYL